MNENLRSSRLSRRSLLGSGLIAGAAVAGCSGMSTAQPRGEGPLTNVTKRPLTLRMGILPSPNEQAWAQILADDFHKVYPNITVKVEQSAQITDIRTLVTSALSHDLPDIMFSSDVNTQTQSSKGLLLDLTPYMRAYKLKESDFLGKIMKLGQWQGRQFVLPRGLDQVIIAYNPELFRKFGVPEPRLGWKWKEFLHTCKQLQQKQGATQFYAMGTSSSYTGYPIYVPFMRGWGGDVATPDGKHTTMDTPQVIRGVTEMMNFYGTYSAAFQSPPVDPFLGGTAAMSMFVRPSMLTVLVNAERTSWTTKFTPKFVNFPLFPVPKIGAGMAGWAGTITTRHPHETAAFLMYTLSRRGQRAYSKAAGEVPVRVDLAHDATWQDVLNFKGTVDQRAFFEFGEAQSFPPDNVPIVSNGQMSAAIGDALDAIRLKTKTVADAMKACNKIVDQTLVGLQ